MNGMEYLQLNRMNVTEYLEQGLLLDQRITFNLRRLQEMKNWLCSIRSPQFDQVKVQTSSDGEAYFVRGLMQVEKMQEQVNREIDLLVDLRRQIEEAIRSIPSDKYQMVLMYKYLEGRTWAEIGDALRVGKSTIKRWHADALTQVRMPQDPIRVTQIL